ncbi:HSD17B12 [Branchiostoma lanceolatum]|uniref:HSD17B12 protein n=1 Tax=Branchiostoma lanceolatum TaxID=7740 RepID=A0A8J9VRP4_BRALA|nr:HSD17B12 [Branchiostoma lanceolatum]
MAVFGGSGLEAAGIVALAYVGIKVLWGVWQTIRLYLLSGPLGLSLDFRNYAGRWAVVTGSTDGIGKAYADQLAARGLNIVLISRSEDKLKAVAAEIESKAGVRTKIVVADFCSSQIYDNIKQELEGLDIACLVNNVGMKATRYPDFFLHVEDEVTETMIYCNVISMIKMTKIVLPGMVERKSGVIINVSSIFATVPIPLMALYAGTKAFAMLFSKSLAVEYKNKGIIIQTVTPSFVSTNMTGRLPTNFFVATPTSFVRSALNTVGLTSHTCGYFPHSLQLWLVGLFPQDMFCNWVTLPAMKKLRELRMKSLQSKKNN